MTCKDCIHKSVCYRIDNVPYDYADKCGDYISERTGHWLSMNTGKQSHLKYGMTTESVKCSECDEWLSASDEYACKGNYCPNCGARM